MSTEPAGPETPYAEDSMEGWVGPVRHRMPVERRSITRKVKIFSNEGSFEMYLTAGVYEDGSLGEVFVRGIGKEGSTTQGLLDAYATMFSIGLQHGAALDLLARKFSHMKFAPYGPTDDPEIPACRSLIDYIMRWLAMRWGNEKLLADLEQIDRRLADQERR